jgi:hypothetical protein
MSDEADAAGSAQRLTELAQHLNQLDAARYSAMAAENPTQLPPHLTLQHSGKKHSTQNATRVGK